MRLDKRQGQKQTAPLRRIWDDRPADTSTDDEESAKQTEEWIDPDFSEHVDTEAEEAGLDPEIQLSAMSAEDFLQFADDARYPGPETTATGQKLDSMEISDLGQDFLEQWARTIDDMEDDVPARVFHRH